ncbi:TetR/AcrR family transcriptional regulator [Nocardia sp. NPDC005978]|uniref:TetR/AcrR family transcriptional regulator n=1 Tax=Nocardia sp. NPDC005978 TaxID=3156725 RepID=UPI0033B77501
MATRRVLTRAESQARTREDLLDAAEQLFFADGYHATSIAAIAAEAGRTIGALYSNFDNKEALCVEVIQRGLVRELAKLMPMLVAAPEDMESRLEVLSRWWARSSTDTALLILGAEYLIIVMRDTAQRDDTANMIRRVIESGRVLLEDFLPVSIPPNDPLTESAVRAIFATGAGLILGSAGESITADESAQLLAETIRLWMRRLLEQAAAVSVAGETA